MGERRRVRVRVAGHVQGVFYRVSCAREARARGIAGWVGNRLGGDVEAAFEGAPADVEAMVAWCRRGPAGARVTEVEVIDEPPEGGSGFEIVD